MTGMSWNRAVPTSPLAPVMAIGVGNARHEVGTVTPIRGSPGLLPAGQPAYAVRWSSRPDRLLEMHGGTGYTLKLRPLVPPRRS
jgi:hypothetical protein